jgi:putative transposase
MINKAYKFRIYPNQAQAILINKTIGCSRFVFNHFLSLWDQAYKETGKGLTYGTCSAKLPAMKKRACLAKKKWIVLRCSRLFATLRMLIHACSKTKQRTAL